MESQPSVSSRCWCCELCYGRPRLPTGGSAAPSHFRTQPRGRGIVRLCSAAAPCRVVRDAAGRGWGHYIMRRVGSPAPTMNAPGRTGAAPCHPQHDVIMDGAHVGVHRPAGIEPSRSLLHQARACFRACDDAAEHALVGAVNGPQQDHLRPGRAASGGQRSDQRMPLSTRW